jgi:hypothetical protein
VFLAPGFALVPPVDRRNAIKSRESFLLEVRRLNAI